MSEQSSAKRRRPCPPLGTARCIVTVCVHLTLAAGCHEPTPVTAPINRVPAPPRTTEPAPDASQAEPVRIPSAAADPDRWLFVERTRGDAPGGWATGSFDPDRNKLTIETKDVQRFAIDTSRIRIDWERLVVLGLNGVNSELRRRDFDIYHFELDDHNRWVVIEP